MSTPGAVYDTIMGTEIPPGNEILLVSPSGETDAYDVYTLAKVWVLTGKLENPLTRQPLSVRDSVRIRSYKKTLITLETGEVVAVSGVCPIWLAIVTITSEVSGTVRDCMEFDILVGSVSLYDSPMSVDLSTITEDRECMRATMRPHTNFLGLRSFAMALSEQQEPIYRELSRDVMTHLRRGCIIRK